MEFSLDHLQVINGTARNLREGNFFDIYPTSEGPVNININANTITGGSFASNEVVVYYHTPTLVPNLKSSEYFKVYPNPSNGFLHILTEPEKSFTVELISCEGKILKNRFRGTGFLDLNLSDLEKGIYFLKMYTDKNVSIQKLILE